MKHSHKKLMTLTAALALMISGVANAEDHTTAAAPASGGIYAPAANMPGLPPTPDVAAAPVVETITPEAAMLDIRGPGPLADDEREKIAAMTDDERTEFHKARMERWHAMSEEERMAAVEKRKEWWQSLTPEKQQEMKDHWIKMQEERHAMKAKFDAMTPDERAAFLKEHEASRPGTDGGMHKELVKDGNWGEKPGAGKDSK